MGFYDYNVMDAEGTSISMAQCKGKVVLIVNVASKCGFTPQYEGLQDLYDKYKDEDFMVIGFPCNQFKGQEPGTNEEIQSFCRLDYGVEFPVMAKIDVNGEDEDPLYTFLKSQKEDYDGKISIKDKASHKMLKGLSSSMDKDSDILWNFEKFLIDKEGNVVGRYAPTTSPEDLESRIKDLL